MRQQNDIEIWRGIPGWIGKYSVSNMGRVRNDRTMYVLTPMRTGNKRMGAQRSKVRFSTHPRMDYDVSHLVLEVFVGLRPVGHLAMHKDDDSTNNRLDNLRWGTHQDNSRDCVTKGRHGMQKLNRQDHEEIKYLREAGFTYVAISEAYGVSPQRACDVVKGRSMWGA